MLLMSSVGAFAQSETNTPLEGDLNHDGKVDAADITVLVDIIMKKDGGTRKYKTFSIIGDSYSTFTGYTDPVTNTQWYPHQDNDVSCVEEMWWYLFANQYGCSLIQNNSYSGSTICYDGYREGHDSAAALISFCKRIEEMTEKCELLIIFGGTNDSWAGSSIGEYKYAEWTEDDKSYFRPALAYLIDYIQHHILGTHIVFILNTGLSDNINTSVTTICSHYDVPLLKLSSFNKMAGHPSASGMASIAEQIINFLN